MTAPHPSLFDEPLARATDPASSHAAASSVAPSVPQLNAAILQASWSLYLPSTAFQIADAVHAVHGDRWDEGTIRTRVSQLHKSGELVHDGSGTSPRGRVADKFRLPSMSLAYSESIEDVPTRGRL